MLLFEGLEKYLLSNFFFSSMQSSVYLRSNIILRRIRNSGNLLGMGKGQTFFYFHYSKNSLDYNILCASKYNIHKKRGGGDKK